MQLTNNNLSALAPTHHKKLPHPPHLPPEAYLIPYRSYCVYFGGAFALLVSALIFGGRETNVIAAILIGFSIVPIFYLQHEIYHQPHKTPWRLRLLNALGIVTGLNGIQWDAHRLHHAHTGHYYGDLIPRDNTSSHPHSLEGDSDDFLGILRKPSFIQTLSEKSRLWRFIFTLVPFLLTTAPFHLLMIIIGFGRALRQQKFIEAIIPLINLFGLVYCIGWVNTLIASITYSLIFQVSVPFAHEPQGAEGLRDDFWLQQLETSCNLDSRNHLLTRLVSWFAGYHIEHHLWQEVPMPNLPQYSELARQYCLDNGIEYKECSLTEAWVKWIREAWKLTANQDGFSG